jgi:hypothetical protein
MVDVTLAGLPMDGSTADAAGVKWTVEEVVGWDSAPVRIDDGDRTGRHGGYGSTRLYAARLLTVSGVADCPSLAVAFAARDRLHTISDGDLVVGEPVPKMVEVVSGGAPRASDPIEGGACWFRFQIPLVAHDPFKLATSARTTPVAAAATVAVDNDGTAAADLLVTLTTGGTVVLTSGGLTLTTTTLPSGAVIDTGACTIVSSGGADLFAAVVPGSQWPALPAGGGSVQQAGTAGLSVVSHDSYA